MLKQNIDYVMFCGVCLTVFIVNNTFNVLSLNVIKSDIREELQPFQLLCQISLKNWFIVYVGVMYTFKMHTRLFYCIWFFNAVVHALMCSIFPLDIAIFIYPISLLEIGALFTGRYLADRGTLAAINNNKLYVNKEMMMIIILLLIGAVYEVYLFPRLLSF